MGQLFELIADDALIKLDEEEECHVCHKRDIDLYHYQGRRQLENGHIDDDIYAACADCILTKNLSHSGDVEYIRTIENYIATSNLSPHEQAMKITSLIATYQKTPGIPRFMQYEDRPLCCYNITEFIGHPINNEELYKIADHNIYWEKQVREKSRLYDFRKYGSPESLKDVASFKCKHCSRQYFTFQFT